jgi:hypothetical protein
MVNDIEIIFLEKTYTKNKKNWIRTLVHPESIQFFSDASPPLRALAGPTAKPLIPFTPSLLTFDINTLSWSDPPTYSWETLNFLTLLSRRSFVVEYSSSPIFCSECIWNLFHIYLVFSRSSIIRINSLPPSRNRVMGKLLFLSLGRGFISF